MADFASESGHWYKPDGTPRYTTIGTNGKERATTLRDARKEGLYPSVTGIIQMAARPGLERWKRTQTMLAALTLPRILDETESEWLVRVEQDAAEQARAAAQRGEQIHGALEHFYRTREIHPDYLHYVVGTTDLIEANCAPQHWKPERSYTHRSGYGCKIDLHSQQWVLDYKTKEFTAAEAPKLQPFDEHIMQLAANRRAAGVPEAQCAVVFVSASVPGLAVFCHLPEEQLTRGLLMFDSLFLYWKAANRFDPALTQPAMKVVQ